MAMLCIVYLYRFETMLKRGYWFVLLVLAGSCLDKPDCYELNNNYAGISFFKLYDGKTDTLSIIGITSPASDSVFYPFVRATGLQLELNPYEPNTDYLIETTLGTYRMVLGYRSEVKFVSEDCGTSTQLSDLEIEYDEFDSVRLVNDILTDPAQTNIQAYRCPRTNFMKVAFRQLINSVEVADTVELANVSLNYPVVYYFPSDSISSISFPLNENANSTSVDFEFTDGSIRSLTVQYTRTLWNEYVICSGLSLIDNLSSTSSTFSQVTVVRDSIQDLCGLQVVSY